MESLDRYLFELFNQTLSFSLFDTWMPYITDLHKQPGFTKITLPILIIAWIWQSRAEAIKAIVMLALCIGCVDVLCYRVLKPTFKRERPPAVEKTIKLRTQRFSGYSFPSNHAANNFAGATVLAYFYPPYAIAFYGVAALVAYSRVYVGVHYPFDVMVGGLLGWFVALCFIFIIKRIPFLKRYRF